LYVTMRRTARWRCRPLAEEQTKVHRRLSLHPVTSALPYVSELHLPKHPMFVL
jgi:hypothetical protein